MSFFLPTCRRVRVMNLRNSPCGAYVVTNTKKKKTDENYEQRFIVYEATVMLLLNIKKNISIYMYTYIHIYIYIKDAVFKVVSKEYFLLSPRSPK